MIFVFEFQQGEVFVKMFYVLVDFYMCGCMQDMKLYVELFDLDEVFFGGVIVEVMLDGEYLKKGDIVIGNFSWQEYFVVSEFVL